MRARASGFTLVEVLVALVIVAVGMAVLMSAMGSAADTTAYLRDKTFAEWIALNEIAVVRLGTQLPPQGKTEGDLDYAGRKWHWEQTVSPLDFPGMLRVDVKVQLGLLRPADIPTTMDIYIQAMPAALREANSKVARIVVR